MEIMNQKKSVVIPILPLRADDVAELIRSLRNSHVILIEDGSFSGKRIKREVGRFLKLMNILFGGFEEEMASHGYKPPWVYLLVVFGTVEALESVQSLGPLGGRDPGRGLRACAGRSRPLRTQTGHDY